MKELGRNEPCHCGSGKKYKNCHMGKSEGLTSNKSLFYISFFVVVLAIVAFSAFYGWDKTPAVRNSAPQSQTPPPPGEAPPGKVWSAEHGHYHDI